MIAAVLFDNRLQTINLETGLNYRKEVKTMPDKPGPHPGPQCPGKPQPTLPRPKP